MATITTPVTALRSRRGVRRALVFVLIAILCAVLGVVAWFYAVARAALPQLDGGVKVSGLSSPVTISRDRHGVPTIDAASFEDLFFAQGYVTAQDRLWQMDIMRRFAAGEISEILGSEFLKHDREQRILGLRVAAEKGLAAFSAQDRSQFEAYARGVNTYIESRRSQLPIEFRILRYSPRPWTPEDSLLIAAQMVKDLNHYPYRDALAREKLLAKLGPELTADLYVNSSWHDRPPTVARPSLNQDSGDDENHNRRFPAGSSVADQQPMDAPHFHSLPSALQPGSEARMVTGSNNWVVAGSHTVSGKPLLSNDMHLGHQMPNLWYEAHLRSGNFDVAGVTLPGVPFVIVGHNQRIAWGFTNVGPTVEDVYVESFNPEGQYLTPDGWKAAEHRREVIRVKGKPDVDVEVTLTRHGPVITDLVPGETRKLALRWTLYDGTHAPFFAVDSAQNWQQFRQAFSAFDAPGQNVVFADIDGNIGYQTTGRIPIRASGDGSLPENGSDNAHEWTGYIPFDKLPSVYNPASGIIATANGRITPDGYPYSISTGWEAPWRTARIYRVLESGKKFSTADMLALQLDIYSDCERFFAERFVYGVDHAKNSSARAKQAAELLRGWDGRMTADSAAPTIGYRARIELTRLLLEPKLGPAPEDPSQTDGTLNWKTYGWGMQSVWLENVLQHQPKRWLPDSYASYDELLAAAVEAAVQSPGSPQDLASWHWGTFHPVEIQHPILGNVPVLRRWTGPGVQPQSGSGYTVKAVSRSHGPSERLTVDLSDLDLSTLNLVTGEAGNFLSPYYMDQWQAWYQGYTFTLPYTRQAVTAAQQHVLTLEPD
ncbi:MAG TPA: penicillin acylase family protein [Terriglobales bacterium]|jgi:penicillin amidase|nr:penicillin acylase family protein [Terriglobales bacterium]